MSITNNSYSDLIHLFIDGEATETERNTLFNALKDSPELQDEFHSAMELKKAFTTDIMNLQPPSYLESQIAERAGIIVAASAAAANAPVVVNAVSNAVSNMAPVATGILSKGVITMIVGTSVGILSTIGVIKLTSNNNSAKTTSPVAPQAVTRQAEPRTAPQSFTTLDQPAPMTMVAATVAEKSAGPAEVKNEKINANSIQNVKENTSEAVKETPAEKIKEITPNAVAEKSSEVANKENNASVAETPKKDQSSMAMISPATPMMPAIHAIGGETDHRLFHSSELMDNGYGIGKFSLRLTAIAASKLSQGNDMNFSTTKNFDWQGAVKYDLDPSDAVGVEFGNEVFPIYLHNANGGYDQHRSISWIGGSFTYSAIYLDLPLGLTPEFRILGAGSTSGLFVMKGSAGLCSTNIFHISRDDIFSEC